MKKATKATTGQSGRVYRFRRFDKPQTIHYAKAFTELGNGKKETHWMWYIFPQLKALGFSKKSKYYGMHDINEAKAFLSHSVFGKRLIDITNQLMLIEHNDISKVTNHIDNLKIKSCMTLFSLVDESQDKPFNKVLDKFFSGESCINTLAILSSNKK
jgi:uncharacterized protein (DUF1810 family)